MTSVADIFVKVNGGEAPTAEEYAVLHAAVDSAETPVNVRVRAVPLLAQHIAANQDFVTKVLASLVKLLEDDKPIVHTTVVKAFVDLCVAAATFLEPTKMVDVVRDTSDVLIQMSLASSGFDADVRKAAKEAITVTLPGVSVLGVAIKCVHLLSNERWNEEPAQLEAERKAALDLLNVITGPKHHARWVEDDEPKLLKFVTHTVAVVSAGETTRLLGAIAQIPSVAAKQGAPLVDAVLKLKLDTPRGVESVTKLRAVLPKDGVNDAIIDKMAPLLTKAKSAEPIATQVARAFCFAARHASAEKAAKHIATVRAALKKNGGESWTFTEALLTSLAVLGAKAPEAMAELLEDAEFRTAVYALAEEASKLELKLSFAAAKAALDKTPTLQHSIGIACLKNVVRMGAFVEVKKVPEVATASWEGRAPLVRAPKTQRAVDVDAPLAAQQRKKPQPKAEGRGAKKN